MQRSVLESLVSRGSFVGILVAGDFSKQNFESLARSLCGEAPFRLAEYSPVDGTARDFFLGLSENLSEYFCTFVLFRGEPNAETLGLLSSMRMVIAVAGSGEEFDSGVLSELEALKDFGQGFFWWAAKVPGRKRFPKLSKAARRATVRGFQSLEDLTTKTESEKIFRQLLEARILSQNASEGWSKLFRRLFVPLALVAFALPVSIPSSLETSPAGFRNLKAEMALYSEAPSFEYTFDGAEPFERIARYAVGRFTAMVTTERMLGDYVAETFRKNGLEESWQKGNLHVPPEGTRLRFSIPDSLKNPAYDSIAPAWRYFTQIVGDSVAYVTELYHAKATAKQRQHSAWDVASRSGARILAPFSGKAWTFQDERGGTVIGISDGERVILFMHCDQLLYLDGQSVMLGDPVATVGTTGHTTGPHVHIVTGLVDSKGAKRLGNIRYTVVNPVTWFERGKGNLTKAP